LPGRRRVSAPRPWQRPVLRSCFRVSRPSRVPHCQDQSSVTYSLPDGAAWSRRVTPASRLQPSITADLRRRSAPGPSPRLHTPAPRRPSAAGGGRDTTPHTTSPRGDRLVIWGGRLPRFELIGPGFRSLRKTRREDGRGDQPVPTPAGNYRARVPANHRGTGSY